MSDEQPEIEGVEPEEQPDVGDARYVRKQQKRARIHQKRLDNALGALLDTYDTRAWLWELLCAFGIYQSSFSTEPLRMAFLEGKRDCGLRLLADINRIAPASYVLMAEEAEKRIKENV